MSLKQRWLSKVLRLSEIHHGRIEVKEEQTHFILNNEYIPRVRVLGVVIDRYDRSGDRAFSLLSLDDGSDTINIKLWSYPEREGEEKKEDQLKMFQGIDVGQIIEIIGRVKEYQDEKYIIPDVVSSNLSLDNEINHRAKLLQRDTENFGFQEHLSSNDNLGKTFTDKVEKFLSIMSDKLEMNTIELLSSRFGEDSEEILEIIKYLQIEGLIINPRPGIYSRIL